MHRTLCLCSVMLSAIACAPALSAQDTLSAPAADGVDIVVLPEVTSGPTGTTYSFVLTSLVTSAQSLSSFNLRVPEQGVTAIQSPPGWFPFMGDRLGTPTPGWKIFAWAAIINDPNEKLSPGGSLSGFSFQSDWLPGVAPDWSRGLAPLPSRDETDMPEATSGWTLEKNSASGFTIGPAYSPTQLATPAPTADVLQEVLDFSADEGWISSQAVTDSLNQSLAEVKQQIAAGDLAAAGAALDGFEQVLDANSGGAINSSAHSVMDLYVQRLRDQGLVPDRAPRGADPAIGSSSTISTPGRDTVPPTRSTPSSRTRSRDRHSRMC